VEKRGGLTTKIVALVDALENLIRLTLLPGQRHDLLGVETVIKALEFAAFLGDKAFDAHWLRDERAERKASVVIPSKSNRTLQIPHNKEVYKGRHLVENYFARIKAFRGISPRYDKTDVSYSANWTLAAGIVAARGLSTGPSLRDLCIRPIFSKRDRQLYAITTLCHG